MIKKITKITNLGVFHAYAPGASAPEFARYNLVYGWNGCGKTTLTRLLSALNSGASGDHPTLDYRVSTDEGSIKSGTAYSVPIWVFNQDYVIQNAPSLLDPGTESKHIFILGEADKTLAAKVQADKQERARLEALLSKDDKKAGITSLNTKKKKFDAERNAIFTGVAKVIASNKGRVFRDYDRRDALKVYADLTEKEDLKSTELDRYQSIAEQKAQQRLSALSLGGVDGGELGDALARVIEKSNELLEQTVAQEAIERLTDNSDIASWVADGIELHASHKSKSCEYCGQGIPADRLGELAKHFNDAHKEFIKQIELQINLLRKIYAQVEVVSYADKLNLYEHLRSDYEKNTTALEAARTLLLNEITALGKVLVEKKTKTHEKISSVEVFDANELKRLISEINADIKKHNEFTDNFEAKVGDAKDKLQRHYVSTVYDQAKALEIDINDTETEIEAARDAIGKLELEIGANEAKIRNSKIACGKLNEMLERFLGRDEIRFEDSENGYLIKRNGEPAHHLSEGEKTAIGFVYFVIGLQSDGVQVRESIIVVDDPISSLDADAVYRVCGLIKTHMKAAKQLIILTHNYEFFNQVKGWFRHDPSMKPKETGGAVSQFLMIKNPVDSKIGRRIAEVTYLDPLLRDYESEYHYLFNRLCKYKDEVAATTRGTIEAVYHYPNIARKTLECFLAFKVPQSSDLYSRMQQARKMSGGRIAADEVEDIYSFINSHSHLNTKTGLMQFDTTLAKNGEGYIQMTLDFIRKCDEQHYNAMIKVCS